MTFSWLSTQTVCCMHHRVWVCKSSIECNQDILCTTYRIATRIAMCFLLDLCLNAVILPLICIGVYVVVFCSIGLRASSWSLFCGFWECTNFKLVSERVSGSWPPRRSKLFELCHLETFPDLDLHPNTLPAIPQQQIISVTGGKSYKILCFWQLTLQSVNSKSAYFHDQKSSNTWYFGGWALSTVFTA